MQSSICDEQLAERIETLWDMYGPESGMDGVDMNLIARYDLTGVKPEGWEARFGDE